MVGKTLNFKIMKNNTFKKLLIEVHQFNNLQFRKLKEEVEKRVKSKKIANILETSKEELICPFCDSNNHIRWGKRNDLQRYKCKECNKTFNSLTKTPLARLRKKGRWLNFSNCLKEGITVRKAAEYCGIHKNTSFRWRHRFICNLNSIKAKKLGGIIETGELIFKESFKGKKKNLPPHNYKRKDVFVIYCLDRNNNVTDITNKGFSKNTLHKELKDKIFSNSLIYSQNRSQISEFVIENKLKHINVNNNFHSLSNINKLESYRTKFEKWIKNHFRGVATKYLNNYVSWFRGLHEFNSGINALTILYRAKLVEKYRHQPIKVTRFI